VQVGDTYLVSCGSYNTNMGHVVLKKDGDRYKIKDYELVPLDESVKDDPLVEAELSKYRKLVDEEYFSQYGYSVSDTVVENQITFPDSSKIGLTQGEEPLGNLLADSYKYAIMQAEKGSLKGYETGGVASGEVTSDQGGVQVTIVPLGVIRGSFLQGSVTVADAFNILSLGYGKDGQAGYPLHFQWYHSEKCRR
jgi:5'-nucleotidase / UDP-sugar diphosphatase